jgi:translation initiation factor 2D
MSESSRGKLTPDRKGALQPIVMGIKIRQGRKTVTVVSGLEAFGIDVDDFAEELRKLCAGSASSELSLPSSPPHEAKLIV